MSKMKHLFRKLHLGGGGGGALAEPHQLHGGEASTAAATAATSPSSPASVEQQTSVEAAVESVENSGSLNGASASDSVPDYGLLEEEFQVQLAMAMSASDSDSRSRSLSLSLEDPETTAQITAAKQISLGCSTSQSLVDFQSLRYWNYDVVNYNERVLDGFYDVFGINTNFLARGKMPSLVELQSIPVVGNVDYEAIIVDRTADLELRRLEERVHLMASEYQTLRMGALMGFFVQKIANIVVEKMGGPVNDAEDMLRRWTARSYEMRTLLNTITLPLGSLDVGLSRQRALLFKVLADRINLPCMLVKGSYYTSTDDGAFSIIKYDDGSEYIIDLMGAPGTLIPSEIPSGQLQNCGLDIRTISPIAENDPHYGFGGPNRTLSVMPGINVPSKINCSNSEQYYGGMENPESRGNASEDEQIEQFKHEFGRVIPSLLEIAESSTGDSHKRFTASEIHVAEFSKNVFNAPQNLKIAQEVEPVLLDNRGELNQSPLNLGKQKQELTEKSLLLKGEKVLFNAQGQDVLCPSNNEKSLIPLSELRFLNYTPYSPDVNSSSPVMAGQGSEVMESEDVLVRAKSDQNYENNDILMKRKDASDSIQSHLYSRDEQVDAMLEGVAEWEIPWEDLYIGERIGIGSFGEVYRSDWNGTEVAVKKFMNQDISGDALLQFKCEVEIMLRLRHPNVVLFMGAVTRPPNLSILTEFLPRGSLFKLLHRSHVQIDERRRLRMALDVARGMNYLHTSNPVIVHRDLKTPNLLVDKNWVVKVCDFGMSRMKHHTFLSSKSAAGTAEWMAPEVLRNEPSSEKSDVFSFGVILWELATMDVPWTGMNSMQVVGAVGFQGRRLTIPDRIDPVVAEIIRNCWDSNQHERPSFKEIIARLKTLQRLVVKRADTEAQQQP